MKTVALFVSILASAFGIHSAYAASQSDTATLAASVSKANGENLDGIKNAVALGRSLGWSTPTSSVGVGLSGNWKFTTSDGTSGTVLFNSNVVSGALASAFKEYSFLQNSKDKTAPTLVVLGPKSDGRWFIPFKKSGSLVLINNANRRQWIRLTK